MVSKGYTNLSLGAGDEPFKMETVSFPLQTTVVWLFSTIATDRKPSKRGTERIWVGATVMEGVEGAEEASFLSGHRETAPMSFLDISTVEFRLVKELVAVKVGDLHCCRDWKIYK